MSLLCPGGPVCVWLESPTPFPGLVGGACAGAAGVAGFGVGFGLGRAGAGLAVVSSRLGAGLGEAGVVVVGGGAGAGAGAGAGTGAGDGAEIGSGAVTCGAAPFEWSTAGDRTTTTGEGGTRGEATSRGAACSLRGIGSTVAGTTVCATTGGAATRTAWSPRWPTRVPGRPIAAVMAPSPAATATSRDQPPLMLEPPSAEQPRSDLIGSGGRNLKDNE